MRRCYLVQKHAHTRTKTKIFLKEILKHFLKKRDIFKHSTVIKHLTSHKMNIFNFSHILTSNRSQILSTLNVLTSTLLSDVLPWTHVMPIKSTDGCESAIIRATASSTPTSVSRTMVHFLVMVVVAMVTVVCKIKMKELDTILHLFLNVTMLHFFTFLSLHYEKYQIT